MTADMSEQIDDQAPQGQVDELAEMSDWELGYEYDYVSGLVLQWQALDARIDGHLRRLSDLTGELSYRAERERILTALSYVPIGRIMSLAGGEGMDLGNGYKLEKA